MAETESDLFGIVLLAIIWGATNTFIGKAVRQDKVESKGDCFGVGVKNGRFLEMDVHVDEL